MDRLKELREARMAADNVIKRIDNAISYLDSASSWGIFDLLGGGLFSSFVKRDKIKSANSNIKELSESLKDLNKELEDVNMNLPGEMGDSIAVNAFDVWFDNIFTDLMVQDEIRGKLKGLKAFRSNILNLISDIDMEIESLER